MIYSEQNDDDSIKTIHLKSSSPWKCAKINRRLLEGNKGRVEGDRALALRRCASATSYASFHPLGLEAATNISHYSNWHPMFDVNQSCVFDKGISTRFLRCYKPQDFEFSQHQRPDNQLRKNLNGDPDIASLGLIHRPFIENFWCILRPFCLRSTIYSLDHIGPTTVAEAIPGKSRTRLPPSWITPMGKNVVVLDKYAS